ncbi:MAG TPA: hypothetical protein VGX00_06730 [Thermoplasmata archaeon]|nr:hypothetical protein [Thermoplasmata archaeon]
MTTYEEQAQMREHLSELRRAARGLGSDFEVRFEELGAKIERLPSLTAKEAKYALYDIEDDFAAMGHKVDAELKKLPGEIGRGISSGVDGIKHGATRLGEATRDGIDAVGRRTVEGTKNALASAAGVRRTPMKQWSDPGSAAQKRDEES